MFNLDNLFNDENAKKFSKPSGAASLNGLPSDLLQAIASGKAEVGQIDGDSDQGQQLFSLLKQMGISPKNGQPIAIDMSTPEGQKIAKLLGVEDALEIKAGSISNSGSSFEDFLNELKQEAFKEAPKKSKAIDPTDILSALMGGEVPDFENEDAKVEKAFNKKHGSLDGFINNSLQPRVAIYGKTMLEALRNKIQATGLKEDSNVIALAGVDLAKTLVGRGLVGGIPPEALATVTAIAAAKMDKMFDKMSPGETALMVFAMLSVLEVKLEELAAETEAINISKNL